MIHTSIDKTLTISPNSWHSPEVAIPNHALCLHLAHNSHSGLDNALEDTTSAILYVDLHS